jgi:hypothetical protein
MGNLADVNLIRTKAYLSRLAQVDHEPHAVTAMAIG